MQKIIIVREDQIKPVKQTIEVSDNKKAQDVKAEEPLKQEEPVLEQPD